MIHQRDGNRHQFDCDAPRCTESFGQTDPGDEDAEFAEVWSAARAEGWVSFRRDGDWVHLCPAHKGRVGG